MARSERPIPRNLVGFAVLAGTALLAVCAARADARQPLSNAGMTVLDVAVGLAFVVAAMWTPAPIIERLLAGVVGATWLVGSFVAGVELLYLAVLIVALLAFPTGRPRGAVGWVMVGLAVVVSLGGFSQIGLAAVFAVVAMTASLGPRFGRIAAWYRALAAISIGVVFFASWIVVRTRPGAYDPNVTRVALEIVLLVVALTLRYATRAVLARGTRLAEQLLADERLVGLEGLSVVLRDVLGDPDLRIYRWLYDSAAYVDVDGGLVLLDDGEKGRTYVSDSAGPLAVLEHRAALLDDSSTAEAVTSVVQLAVQNVRLGEELDAQVVELGAARVRLLAAADRQRSATAARLREDVVVPLQRARSELSIWSSSAMPDGDMAEAMAVAIQELATATDEVMALVGGVPPALLGGGRLRAAVEVLARRSPIPVTVTACQDVGGDEEMETAMFYVCSEAMTNAAKHSRAARIVVSIDGTAQDIAVSVTDDGIGGADAGGSGLQGLADRLATRGGRLRVESPSGAGTKITAILPR